MDINWKAPFELAGELALLVLGWSLVALVVLFAIAMVLGLVGSLRTVVAKSKIKNAVVEAKATLKSVD